MRYLYFDCFSGFDNEMLLGAFVDLGVNPEYVQNILNDNGFKAQIVIEQIKRQEISAKNAMLTIECDDEILPFNDVVKFIENIDKTYRAKVKSIFEKISHARAKISKIQPQQTTYSKKHIYTKLARILAAIICIDTSGADCIVCSKVTEGSGLARNGNFVYPIPKASTMEIIKTAKIPIKSINISSELISEDGAAVLAQSVKRFGTLQQCVILSVGYGSGSEELEIPNLLRVAIAEDEQFNFEEFSAQISVELNNFQELNV